MSNNVYKVFCENISNERLEVYTALSLHKDEEEALKLYWLNLEIVSFFNYIINPIEVLLRNKIHSHFTNKYQCSNWVECGKFQQEYPNLYKDLSNKIENTKPKPKKDEKNYIEKVISRLTFGTHIKSIIISFLERLLVLHKDTKRIEKELKGYKNNS
ncbi:MAG: hypothetical protein LBH40_03530 [Alphaproteobacteria bacterium]|jgi:hypothetical protein|nr:hypothetical protein [Alphaproteobacteria bacterium]